MDHHAHLFWQVSITASDGQLCHLVVSLFSSTLLACQVSTEILRVKLKPFVWGGASFVEFRILPVFGYLIVMSQCNPF